MIMARKRGRWSATSVCAAITILLAAAPAVAAEPGGAGAAGRVDAEHHHHGMNRDALEHGAMPAPGNAGPYLPPITPAARAAAFPKVSGRPVHGRSIQWYALFDQLEWQDADGASLSWDASGWIGGDLNRFWLRSEGERTDGRTEDAEVQLLYGRAIARWWEAVGGVRHDFAPGSSRTWAAFGVQGVAPYWLEVEVTAFIGEGGQTAARLEAEYELLLTNRLVLQPHVELNLHGQDDRSRGIGSGFSDLEAGLRLRYELRPEIAPYIGVSWSRKLDRTADFAELEGEDAEDARLVAGIRIWL